MSEGTHKQSDQCTRPAEGPWRLLEAPGEASTWESLESGHWVLWADRKKEMVSRGKNGKIWELEGVRLKRAWKLVWKGIMRPERPR